MKTIRISESVLREMPMFQPTNQTNLGLIEKQINNMYKFALIDENKVYAYISVILRKEDVYEVSLSVGDRGYGAFMYELAMNKIYPNYLIPSSYETSGKARNVWYNYFQRKDIDRKEYPSEQYDTDYYMNFAYRVKTPKEYSQLFENGTNIVKNNNLNIDTIFMQATNRFLNES